MPIAWQLGAALLVSLVAWSTKTTAPGEVNSARSPKRLIIDSDLLNFVDDALALGLANVLQSTGHVHIAGMMASVRSRYVPPAMDAINTYYHHGDIPIAIQQPLGNMPAQTIDPLYPQYADFLTGLTNDFPNNIRESELILEPQRLYRKLLSEAPDNSVTIALIGFHENVYSLLRSEPDDISPLTGTELARQKVAELVVQGNPTGESFNFHRYDPSAAIFVLTNWPGLVTFVPDTVGDGVWIGDKLTTEMDITKVPVAYAFATAIGTGKTHRAWDAAATYYAMHGLSDIYVVDSRGEVYFNADGSAAWDTSSADSTQRVLALQQAKNGTLAAIIEDALIWDPRSDGRGRDASL